MPPHNNSISSTTATSSKFICNNCNKIFNTNSHLTQHKNKKKPCFATNLLTNHNEVKNTSLILVNDKPFNDFMVKYQELLKQNYTINNVISEYQTKNKELIDENIKYKLMIKSIFQIITKKNLEVSNLELDEIIVLPKKEYNKLNKCSPDSIVYVSQHEKTGL